MLTPTLPADSSCRLLYSGAVGTAGVDLSIALDLSALPGGVLEDPNFVDNWRVFVRQQPDLGVSEVQGTVDFTISAAGIPTQMLLTLDAALTGSILDLEAVYTPTSVR